LKGVRGMFFTVPLLGGVRGMFFTVPLLGGVRGGLLKAFAP